MCVLLSLLFPLWFFFSFPRQRDKFLVNVSFFWQVPYDDLRAVYFGRYVYVISKLLFYFLDAKWLYFEREYPCICQIIPPLCRTCFQDAYQPLNERNVRLFFVCAQLWCFSLSHKTKSPIYGYKLSVIIWCMTKSNSSVSAPYAGWMVVSFSTQSGPINAPSLDI